MATPTACPVRPGTTFRAAALLCACIVSFGSLAGRADDRPPDRDAPLFSDVSASAGIRAIHVNGASPDT